MTQQQEIANVLLDALVALDTEDHEASVRAVPVALARLQDVAGAGEGVQPVAYGAMTLAHACIALVANLKDVDRLDVIAALRPLFAEVQAA